MSKSSAAYYVYLQFLLVCLAAGLITLSLALLLMQQGMRHYNTYPHTHARAWCGRTLYSELLKNPLKSNHILYIPLSSDRELFWG